jgi:hypothetical protein
VSTGPDATALNGRSLQADSDLPEPRATTRTLKIRCHTDRLCDGSRKSRIAVSDMRPSSRSPDPAATACRRPFAGRPPVSLIAGCRAQVSTGIIQAMPTQVTGNGGRRRPPGLTPAALGFGRKTGLRRDAWNVRRSTRAKRGGGRGKAIVRQAWQRHARDWANAIVRRGVDRPDQTPRTGRSGLCSAALRSASPSRITKGWRPGGRS